MVSRGAMSVIAAATVLVCASFLIVESEVGREFGGRPENVQRFQRGEIGAEEVAYGAGVSFQRHRSLMLILRPYPVNKYLDMSDEMLLRLCFRLHKDERVDVDAAAAVSV